MTRRDYIEERKFLKKGNSFQIGYLYTIGIALSGGAFPKYSVAFYRIMSP